MDLNLTQKRAKVIAKSLWEKTMLAENFTLAVLEQVHHILLGEGGISDELLETVQAAVARVMERDTFDARMGVK